MGGGISEVIFFTSDWHYGHEAIIEYTKAPFTKIGAKNRTVIANYKKCVGEGDTCYFLGDLSLVGPANWRYIEAVFKHLPGRKILILGNHDKLNPFTYVDIGFESAHTSLILPEHNLALVHDPSCTIVDSKFTWLCGHVHTLFKQIKNPDREGSVINVSLEPWEYFPVSLLELKAIDDNIIV